MSWYSILFLILVVIAVAAVGFYLVKNVVKLIINSVLGLAILFILNYLHVMSWIGKPDITINWITLLVCALGGAPGALLLIILHLFGYVV